MCEVSLLNDKKSPCNDETILSAVVRLFKRAKKKKNHASDAPTIYHRAQDPENVKKYISMGLTIRAKLVKLTW